MATVTFRRTADVNSIPIIDGSLVFDLAHNKIYMDNGDTRIQYGGDTDLITNPSIASTVNAFSAVGSLDLFLQKTNVINTKAEALNITQNNVPLGCLAFKEMLGTTDYSGVGNGTVSGAITNLNGRTNTAQTGVNNLVSQLKTGSTSFYFDSKNGKWGWNSDPARGAGTFHPFKQASSAGTYTIDALYDAGGSYSGAGSTIVQLPRMTGDGVLAITQSIISGYRNSTEPETNNVTGEITVTNSTRGTSVSYSRGGNNQYSVNVTGKTLNYYAGDYITIYCKAERLTSWHAYAKFEYSLSE